MSKRALVLVAVAALAVPGVAACGDNEGGTVSGEGGTGSPSASGTGSPSGTGSGAPAEGAAVTVEGSTFNPATVTVTTGQSVTWTFRDPFNHTVTADDASFDSGAKQGGATFIHTFDKAGSFPYHCSIHPSMKGTVTVS